MTSCQPGSCERLPTGWHGLMSEAEWEAIAPWFVNQPELCQELHTIIGEMSLPSRRSFLAHLSERHSACPNRRPTRQVLAAIASTYVEASRASGQRRPRAIRAIPQPQPTPP
jgi:hypothetical protein